jgi:ribosomal protein S18 acetylase RimI-like enzyme
MTEKAGAHFGGQVRPATAEDEGFVLGLMPRLYEFITPAWRDAELMTRVDSELVEKNLRERPEGTAVLVAEEGGERLGFVHLFTSTDHYSGEAQGYVSDLVVAPGGEGRGVASALLAASEEWARGLGYRVLWLYVFSSNGRARHLYERHGYGEDFIRCVKQL